MAVTSCKLQAVDTEMDIDELVRRTIKLRFLVETDSILDGPLTIEKFSSSEGSLGGMAPGSVLAGAMWSTYGAFCNSYSGWDLAAGTNHCGRNTLLLNKSIRRLGNAEDIRKKWLLTVTYKVPPQGWEAGFDPLNNPLDWPVMYLSDNSLYNQEVDFDANGSAIVNPAGDPYDPPVQRVDNRPVLIAIKNMWPLNDIIQIQRNYKDALNSDTFHNAPPGTAKMASIKYGPLQTLCVNGETINYYPVAFRVEFVGTTLDGFGTGTGTADNDDWFEKRVKRGPHVSISGVKQYPRVTAGTGSPAHGEFVDYVNLNEDGTKRDESMSPLTHSIGKYRSKNFGLLGI